METKITHLAKDIYHVTIWGKVFGEINKSDIRLLIHQLDIGVYH